VPSVATTRWSLVLAARGGDDAGRDALDALCRAYRPVALAYFRRHGDAGEAEDATQAFFLHFTERGLAARADPGRGRFRGFLYASLENHRRQAWRHAHAAGRDAGAVDPADLAPETPAEPDAAFDRDWALRVLARAQARLAEEATRAGKQELFAALQPCLAEAPGDGDYARLGAALAMSPNHVAVAVKRLRERLRALVRRELADTLPVGADVDAELAWLRAALRSG
jgi:RNA polymerase sigma-70 factor (ECF subfamily)